MKNCYDITSNQSEVHAALEIIVKKHAATDYRAPISAFQRELFVAATADVSAALILDLGCGTGLSTCHLAGHFTSNVVLGIDKSWHRLARDSGFSSVVKRRGGIAAREPLPLLRQGNRILLQADAVNVIRLAMASSLKISKVYLLYPNPWPKAEHVMRRWHGHPVFPALLQLGAEIELRTNWRLYAEEFVGACGWLGRAATLKPYAVATPISLFEKKYHEAGITLFRVLVGA